jgi:hypothetical protein
LENKNSKRPVCTPDGPECPPCPEGVEAGWCADEDERQDVDDESETCKHVEGSGGCNGGDDEPEGGDGNGEGAGTIDVPSSLFGEDENEGNGEEPERNPEPVID